jgi:galactokinase
MDKQNFSKEIKNKFIQLFNSNPLLVISPGRVNLIGEHTDYNNGFVLPAAIDKAIYFAVSLRNDDKCVLYSFDMEEQHESNLNALTKSPMSWVNYLLGVADQLIKAGYKIKGFNCVFGGNIPIGAGLSSSAAIEAGLAFALNDLNSLNIDKLELVKLAQKAENEFVGLQCGIMDQYINIFGIDGNALLIDCKSLEYSYYPFHFNDVSIALFNTGVTHALASSEYNKRRAECNEGIKIIRKKYAEVASLRDVSVSIISEFESLMDAVIYKRCKYVIEENARVLSACKALEAGDLNKLGALLYESHNGLQNDYEISCDESDFLVGLAKNEKSIYGARQMGGGFGGCTINIITKKDLAETSQRIKTLYDNKFNHKLKIYITNISGGTRIIE